LGAFTHLLEIFSGAFVSGCSATNLLWPDSFSAALAVQLIPVTVLYLGSFLLPFSPRWLLSVGRDEEAWQVVKRLHDDPSDPEFAITEFTEMKAQIELERRTGSITPWGKARMAFSRASYRKRLGLGFLLQMGNQSVRLYYANG
jgi:hypothetical protein